MVGRGSGLGILRRDRDGSKGLPGVDPAGRIRGLNPDTVLTIGTDGGIIAVVLLVGAVGVVGAACRRRDVLASCAAGAAVAFVVCGVVDVDWQLPAVGLLGGCVAALATNAPLPPNGSRGHVPPRVRGCGPSPSPSSWASGSRR